MDGYDFVIDCDWMSAVVGDDFAFVASDDAVARIARLFVLIGFV